MKPLFAKTSNLITCLYQPSLSLFSSEPELKKLLGESSDDRVVRLLGFVLSQEAASVIPGLHTFNEVDRATKTGED